MNHDDYIRITYTLPLEIIIDLKKQVHALRVMFGEHEYLMSCIIEDVADMANFRRAISYRSKELLANMVDWDVKNQPETSWGARKVQLFDRMIHFEQVALDVQREIAAQKLYALGRFMPYRYETTLADGSVVLAQITYWQEFLDTYPQAVDLYSS